MVASFDLSFELQRGSSLVKSMERDEPAHLMDEVLIDTQKSNRSNSKLCVGQPW